MTMVSFEGDTARAAYSPEQTMHEARARYFRESGFADDGGYGDAWVDAKIGPIPMPFPNTPARVRAVRYHDLHHVLTGYRTDYSGEVEIAAWEIGAGCKGMIAAWQLNLSAMASGILFMPKKTLQAFARGRRSQSLYGLEFEPLLGWTVARTREAMRVPEGSVEVGLADRALFALAVTVGWVVGLVSFALFLPLVPFGLLTHFLRERARRSSATRAVEGSR